MIGYNLLIVAAILVLRVLFTIFRNRLAPAQLAPLAHHTEWRWCQGSVRSGARLPRWLFGTGQP